MPSIVEYPAGAIKLNKFFGPSVRLLVDGMPFENHRLDIVFPSEAEVKASIEKLVRVAMPTREDAVRFIIGVLDEYNSVIREFASPKVTEPGPVNSKDIG